MLEEIFSSRTRVKLFSIFLGNPGRDYFVRELTRVCDEQINSIRRELENLKRIGFLKSRLNNNKKYYAVNPNFPILEELRSIFVKVSGPSSDILLNILECGDIDLIAISGKLISQNNSSIELLIVGEIEKTKIDVYLKKLETNKKHEIRFAIFTKKDFLYRINLNDRFLSNFLRKEKNIIIYDKINFKRYL